MTRIAPLLILLALAACASPGAAPPSAKGPWHVLNAGQWDINPALVSAPSEEAR